MIPLLEMEDITVRFHGEGRETVVLQEFSLSVYPGELLCILGPSGCGKTTTLKVAGSFIAPDSGTVRLEGRRTDSPDPQRVMVFQEQDQLFPWKRVLDNVAFGLNAGSSPTREEGRRRCRQALSEVGLAEVESAFPHQLSGGMRQRVALARALVGRPRLLLMDEPFGSVDAPQRRELQLLLQRLLADHRGTAVFVTHDVDEALLLGTRILVMGRDGSIVLEGPADDLPRARLFAALNADSPVPDQGRSSR